MSWRLKLAKMRLKRLFCRHEYSDANLTSYSVSGGIQLRNYCVKCGKIFTVHMSNRYIDQMIEEDKEKMSKDGYFKDK